MAAAASSPLLVPELLQQTLRHLQLLPDVLRARGVCRAWAAAIDADASLAARCFLKPSSDGPCEFHPALAVGSALVPTWAVGNDPTQGGPYWPRKGKVDWGDYYEDESGKPKSFWVSFMGTRKPKFFENRYLLPEFVQLGGSAVRDQPATRPAVTELKLRFSDQAVSSMVRTMTTGDPDCCEACWDTYHEVLENGRNHITVKAKGEFVTVWEVVIAIHETYAKLNPFTDQTGGRPRGLESQGEAFSGIRAEIGAAGENKFGVCVIEFGVCVDGVDGDSYRWD